MSDLRGQHKADAECAVDGDYQSDYRIDAGILWSAILLSCLTCANLFLLFGFLLLLRESFTRHFISSQISFFINLLRNSPSISRSTFCAWSARWIVIRDTCLSGVCNKSSGFLSVKIAYSLFSYLSSRSPYFSSCLSLSRPVSLSQFIWWALFSYRKEKCAKKIFQKGARLREKLNPFCFQLLVWIIRVLFLYLYHPKYLIEFSIPFETFNFSW